MWGPKVLQLEEVSGVIAITAAQVIHGADQKLTLADLVAGGGSIIVGGERVKKDSRLYPIGTAKALAILFRHRKS
jgi:hypothetical protein